MGKRTTRIIDTTPDVVKWEIYISKDDERGIVTACIMQWEPDGQSRILSAKEFGPASDYTDISAWAWKRINDARRQLLL